MNRAVCTLAAAAVGALFYASCGGSVGNETSDAGTDATSPSAGGGSGNNAGGGGACGAPTEPCCSDATCETGLTCTAGVCLSASGGTGGNGGGSSGDDGSVAGDDGSATDGSSPDASTPPDTDASLAGGGPVDAGYYYGDGSFWVDGGAYPPPSDASVGGGLDASTLDASAGCQSLAACCATLSGGLQTLCDSIAQAGGPSNCSTELAQLQAEGDCDGVTVLASQVQVTPTMLVSDGTLLFWTTGGTPGLFAMPVQGGPITVVLDAPVGVQNVSRFGSSYFLAVDDTNIYVTQGSSSVSFPGSSVVRIPKNGAPPTLINESGANVSAATMLGSTAFWLEDDGSGGNNSLAFRSAPLLGGPVSTIAAAVASDGPPPYMAVTSGTVFFGWPVQQLMDFPMTGVPAGGPPTVAAGVNCEFLTSDTDAIYCAQQSGSNLRLASDGTSTALGPAVDSSTIVFDDTNAYWADMTTVGTIVKAPKAGGGSATVLANDASPTAVAVDANAVYWADQAGFIKSIPK